MKRLVVHVLVLMSLTAAACGSRLDRAQLATANNAFFGPVPGSQALPAADTRGLPVPSGEADPAALSSLPGGAPPAPADRSPAVNRTESATGGKAGGSIVAGTVLGTAAEASKRSSAIPGSSNAGAGPASAGAPMPVPGAGGATPGSGTAPAAKGDIILGSFGTESGILGVISGSAAPGLRAWVADVNSRGGLNGHRIRLLTEDDGADPSRTQAIVRRMVEQDHVVAFVYHYAFNLQSVVKYLESKNVPLIGGIGTDPGEDHSPVIFEPLVGADVGIGWSLILAIVAQTEKRKLGFIYCREVAGCSLLYESTKAKLPYEGLELVYSAQASLAQPDYTAEILSAQRAGADVIILILDTSAVGRVANSAKRQNYRPVFAGAYNLETPQALQIAELDGLVMPSRQGAYDSSPRTQGYRDAMARYQPNAVRGGLGAGAFTVGKLLERVAPLLGDQPGPADFIKAMHSLRGERLGGLLPGITFPDGDDHTSTNQCIIPIRVDKGRFVAHDAAESFVCAPGWKGGQP